jgi:hypothetical protein
MQLFDDNAERSGPPVTEVPVFGRHTVVSARRFSSPRSRSPQPSGHGMAAAFRAEFIDQGCLDGVPISGDQGQGHCDSLISEPGKRKGVAIGVFKPAQLHPHQDLTRFPLHPDPFPRIG